MWLLWRTVARIWEVPMFLSKKNQKLVGWIENIIALEKEKMKTEIRKGDRKMNNELVKEICFATHLDKISQLRPDQDPLKRMARKLARSYGDFDIRCMYGPTPGTNRYEILKCGESHVIICDSEEFRMFCSWLKCQI
jgi:hypothetical protein